MIKYYLSYILKLLYYKRNSIYILSILLYKQFYFEIK